MSEDLRLRPRPALEPALDVLPDVDERRLLRAMTAARVARRTDTNTATPTTRKG